MWGGRGKREKTGLLLGKGGKEGRDAPSHGTLQKRGGACHKVRMSRCFELWGKRGNPRPIIGGQKGKTQRGKFSFWDKGGKKRNDWLFLRGILGKKKDVKWGGDLVRLTDF